MHANSPSDDPGKQHEIRFGGIDLGDSALVLEPLISELRVGDVLLVRPLSKHPWLSSMFQSPHIFHWKHRRWNHAALYIGGSLVIEKQLWPFWRYDTLQEYCQSRQVVVRRYIAGFSHEQELMLLRKSITLLKEAYNPLKFIGMGAASLVGGIKHIFRQIFRAVGLDWFKPKMRDGLSGRGMICTDLLEQCFRAAVDDYVVPKALWPLIEYRLVPAAVSWSPNFETIDVPHMIVGEAFDEASDEAIAQVEAARLVTSLRWYKIIFWTLVGLLVFAIGGLTYQAIELSRP